MTRKKVVAVIGAGRIGAPIALALAKSGRCAKVIAVRRNSAALGRLRAPRLATGSNAARAAERANVLFIAVKPGDAGKVLPDLSRHARGKIVISLMAAISTKDLEAALPGAKVARAMPNIAAMIGESMTAFCLGRRFGKTGAAEVHALLRTFGDSLETPEHLMDAVTALSGSGPAYIAMMIEALVAAGLKVGIPRDTALRLATKTLTGTADLLNAHGMHPAELRDSVTTPAGTTIAGIYELEKGALRTAVMNAVEAATSAAERIAKKFAAAE